MIVNAHVHQYRVRSMRPGMRQRVAAGRATVMSPSLRRAIMLVLAVAAVVLVAAGQCLHWAVVRQYEQVEQVRAISAQIESANIELRARRAGMLSPAHIEALAAVRLGLHAPVKGQVHRL